MSLRCGDIRIRSLAYIDITVSYLSDSQIVTGRIVSSHPEAALLSLTAALGGFEVDMSSPSPIPHLRAPLGTRS